MENHEILDSGFASSAELSLSSAAKDYLLQTAKWAKFLAIISILFAVLIIVFGLAFSTIMNFFMKFSPAAGMNSGAAYPQTASVAIAVIYGLLGLVMLYPGVRLFQFAIQSKNAIDSNDNLGIEIGLKRLRSVFRFYGIFTIIMLAVYALAILGMLVGLSSLK